MAEELGWYRELIIDFKDGQRAVFEITRKPTGTHIPAVRNPAPWTKLGFQKCPCCPLPGDSGYCPAAISLQSTLDRLRHHMSTEVVTATAVDDAGRKETVTEPLQTVGGVLVQLAVFASECPIGRRVKPHLSGLSPFLSANDLIQQLTERIVAAGGDMDQFVKPLHEVFVYLLRRIVGGGEKTHEDAIPNSVVRIDAIAQALSFRARRLNEGLSEQLGWGRRKKLDTGLWNKFRGFFGG